VRTTTESADTLRAKGWVAVWGETVERMERAGVPIVYAPVQDPSGGPTTTEPMAPRWAIELVVDWPNAHTDPLLTQAIRETYLHDDPVTFSAALLSAQRLDGARGVRVMLDHANLERRIRAETMKCP